MARDSGRYDAFTDTWIDDNVRIDFAWGNIPIQPNDDRDEELVYELDSHSIAIDGYGGYPGINDGSLVEIPQVPMPADIEYYAELLISLGLVPEEGEADTNTVGPELNGQVTTTFPPAGTMVPLGTSVEINYLGTYVALATVPNLAGMAWITANSAIEGAGFVVGNTSGQTLTGSNGTNANTVASQTPAAGAEVPAGSTIDYVTYAAFSDATTGPIAGINRNASAAGGSLNGDQAVLYVTGHETYPAPGSTITISGTANSTYNQTATVVSVQYDDSFNTGGTAVKITFAGSWSTPELSLGGTWTIGV